jgi:uncharacterized protein YdeI (YjbR/CyaY-like superfamily)
MSQQPKPVLPVLPFTSAAAWEDWLVKNHQTSQGIWLQFFKKGSNVETVAYSDAVDVALCFGWIDSQMKKYDEKSYIQKFTPRRSKSIWSHINTQKIEKLTKEKRMQPAGLKEVEEAKKDGRWQQAYGSSSTMKIPPDFLKELSKHPKAKTFFETLNKSNTYAISWRIETAKKPETRERRINTLIAMLEKGEKLY